MTDPPSGETGDEGYDGGWPQVLLFFRSVLAFCLVAVASYYVGKIGRKHVGLPVITGNLFVGALAGPYIAGCLTQIETKALEPVSTLALAFIAVAAGAEMVLQELRPIIGTILKVTVMQMLWGLGGAAGLLLAVAEFTMPSLSFAQRIAVAFVTAIIMSARSPSSAIAIVAELRAKGPFTQICLGVTMLRDVIVVVAFGVALEVAALTFFPSDDGFDPATLGFLVAEILSSFVLGAAVSCLLLFLCWADGTAMGKFLEARLPWLHGHLWVPLLAPFENAIRGTGVVLLGFAVFQSADALEAATEFKLEPLLALMTASFLVVNFTAGAESLEHALHAVALPATLTFFTLTGAAMNLEVLVQVFPWAMAFFAFRMITVLLGSWTGGLWAGEMPKNRNISWATYITQAGVALALVEETKHALGAQEAKHRGLPVDDFLVDGVSWADAWATTVIGSIVIAQLVGPVAFKFAIRRVGEDGQAAKDDEQIARQLQRCNTGVFNDAESSDIIAAVEAKHAHQAAQDQEQGRGRTESSRGAVVPRGPESSPPPVLKPGSDAQRWAMRASAKEVAHARLQSSGSPSTSSIGSVSRLLPSVGSSVGASFGQRKQHTLHAFGPAAGHLQGAVHPITRPGARFSAPGASAVVCATCAADASSSLGKAAARDASPTAAGSGSGAASPLSKPESPFSPSEPAGGAAGTGGADSSVSRVRAVRDDADEAGD